MMKITNIKCNICKGQKTRVIFVDDKNCPSDLCCDCCKKNGLQTSECKMDTLEFERYIQGKQLNENDIKGMLLERPVSNALKALKIPHNHNPFNNTYPCYQNKSPDIVIEKLSVVIECKNLAKNEVDHLTRNWLDVNVINRQHNKGYERKRVLFSYKPRLSLVRYLNEHGWGVYGLGTQILTPKKEKKAVGKLKQKFYWLRKEYYADKLSKPKEQKRL